MSEASSDSLQLRRAANTVAFRIALAIALMVVVVFIAAALYMLYVSGHPQVDPNDTSARVYLESNDMLKAMAVAGVLGILAAGAIGWFSARSAIRPLGAALSLQRRFVQDASHELRTPLTILDTRIQLAQAKVEPGSDAAKTLQQIRADTAALTATVEELLLAATAGGQGELQQQDLAAVMVDVAAGLADVAAARGVNLTIKHDAETPVLLPANSLRRAILALVDNAVNHTPDGGTVSLSAHCEAKKVLFRVADTGAGISGIEASRIFDRFARSTAAAPGGRSSYGIGLALVREIAVAAGGSINVESTGPQGTVMVLELPRG